MTESALCDDSPCGVVQIGGLYGTREPEGDDMRITPAGIRDTLQMGAMGPRTLDGPATLDEVQARDQAATRRKWLEVVRASGREELQQQDLRKFGPWLEHVPTGRLYFRNRGMTGDLKYHPSIAFFAEETGVVMLLDPSPSVQTRAEYEARRAQRKPAA